VARKGETRVLVRGGLVFDGTGIEPYEGDVLTEGDRIVDIAARPEHIYVPNVDILEAEGLTVIPGLIDAHVHIGAVDVDIQGQYRRYFTSELALRMSLKLRELLDQGFTTVRDAGGADAGFRRAVEAGVVPGPRLLVSGSPISQTGGHGDMRSPWEEGDPCLCGAAVGMQNVVVDGPDEVRRAVRNQLRRGANQIKVMASGGAMSPSDSLQAVQFSPSELRAVVEEANNAGTYVLAHAYTSAAVQRCVDAGVRCIEHANLVNAETANLLATTGIAVTPTIATYEQLFEYGARHGIPQHNLDKISIAYDSALTSLQLLDAAGAKIGLGSDLLGPLSVQRLRSLVLHAKVLGPKKTLISATRQNAENLGVGHITGTLEPAKSADVVVVRGDILNDMEALRGENVIDTVIARGQLVKRLGRLLV